MKKLFFSFAAAVAALFVCSAAPVFAGGGGGHQQPVYVPTLGNLSGNVMVSSAAQLKVGNLAAQPNNFTTVAVGLGTNSTVYLVGNSIGGETVTGGFGVTNNYLNAGGGASGSSALEAQVVYVQVNPNH